MDTIFAQATAPGIAGISVIRVSGPKTSDVVENLCRKSVEPRRATRVRLVAQDGRVLDEALVLFFAAPNSFTGENVAEFQVHGSTAVVSAVISEISTYPECRLAEPGEFTKRALANGKMDVVQVEGLADLLAAQTEMQRRQAQASFAGEFTDFVEKLRADLLRAAALLEAVIDFADEEVPEDVSEEVGALLQSSLTAMNKEIGGQKYAEKVRNGFQVAIVGPPNTGKSTLLNRLAGRDAAITSEYAGTTRDVIEVQMDFDGIPATLLDTAGVRDTDDPVEQMGVELALKRAKNADVRVFLREGEEELPLSPRENDIVLRAKVDASRGLKEGISGLTGAGVDSLLTEVRRILSQQVDLSGLATRERHSSALRTATEKLVKAQDLVESGSNDYDIASEEIRSACRGLDELIGRVDVDHLLDIVFSSFCLGK